MISTFKKLPAFNLQTMLRLLRVFIGAAILWQAFIEANWMLSVPGFFFLIQGLTNIGCEARGNCKI